MDIQVANTATDAMALTNQGYCPVECAFGSVSVMDDLMLDHHGDYSSLPAVSIRAFEQHYGVRANDPRFAVAASPDADSSFAIACLAGRMPSPAECRNAELETLARLVAARDIDALNVDLTQSAEGGLLLLYDALRVRRPDSIAWSSAVANWRWLLTAAAAPDLALACINRDGSRQQLGRRARVVRFGQHVAMVFAKVWAFDVWCRELAPVILRFDPGAGLVMAGCRSHEAIQSLLGPRGLNAVFESLEPHGWGGREIVGGSPRGVSLTEGQARNAAARVAQAIDEFGGSHGQLC